MVDDLNGRNTRLREGVEQFGHGMPRVAQTDSPAHVKQLGQWATQVGNVDEGRQPLLPSGLQADGIAHIGPAKGLKISAVVTRVLSRKGAVNQHSDTALCQCPSQ